MRDELCRIDFVRRDRFQQHRRGDRVNEARRDGDVLTPEALKMQVDLDPMNADIRNRPARGNDILANQERSRHANGLYGRIDTASARQFHHGFDSLVSRAIDRLRSTKPLRGLKAIIIEINHNDFGRRIELRGQQRCKTDRSGADDRDRAAWRDLAVENAALEACRQNIAEHHESFFVDLVRDAIKARICVRNANVFGLRPVNLVAKNPAAGRAMRIHAPPAIFAASARGDARDKNMVARLERCDTCADFLDDTGPLMTQNSPWTARRDVALQDMEISPAYRCLRNLHDRVARLLHLRHGPILDGFVTRAFVDERFHCHPRLRCHGYILISYDLQVRAVTPLTCVSHPGGMEC